MENIEEYNESIDWYEDDNRLADEVPDFVQQFAEKCDREEKEQRKVSIIGVAACVAFVVAVFYVCWQYYVG